MLSPGRAKQTDIELYRILESAEQKLFLSHAFPAERDHIHDIEQASGMRQPEVSIAMRPLREELDRRTQ
jgi:predicted transcriptional regulator